METTATTKAEFQAVLEQIEALIPTVGEITCADGVKRPIAVTSLAVGSMIDGKCRAALLGRSCQRWPQCDALPKQMNDVDALLKRDIDRNALYWCLSITHAWLRFVAYLLHIGYRLGLDPPVWKVTKRLKPAFTRRKRRIQADFVRLLKLRVDYPLAGAGTSTDGNTARKLFRNPKIFSDVTGVDLELIERFSTILGVLNCKKEVNWPEFHSFSVATYRLAVTKYPWYYVPSSVHSVLLHAAPIMSVLDLPPTFYDEGSGECQNKIDRRNRLEHARKCSREHNLTDVVHAHLESSDPLVVSHMRFKRKKATPLTDAMKALLHLESTADINADSDSDDDGSESESDAEWNPEVDS